MAMWSTTSLSLIPMVFTPCPQAASLCFSHCPPGKEVRSKASLSSSLHPPSKHARSQASIHDEMTWYNYTPKTMTSVVQQAMLQVDDV